MSKGQIQILTEFLGFAIGIAVVISITYVFSTYLGPLVIDEAMSFHLKNIVKQIQVSSSSLIHYADNFENKNITLFLNLPDRLNRYSYEVFRSRSDLCAAVTGTDYKECENNSYDISGLYISGTRMKLEIRAEGSERNIYMSSS